MSAVATEPPVPEVVNPEFFADPGAAIAWLHENDPVHWYDPRPGYHTPMWLVSKAEDIRFIESADELFTTTMGVTLAHVAFNPPDDPRFAVAMRMPNMYDAPEHTFHRNMLLPHFRPKRLMHLEDPIRKIVRECLDKISEGETADFSEKVANPVPMHLTLDLLGLDRSEADRFLHWSHVIFEMFEPGNTPDTDMMIEMMDYFEAELEDRRRNPREDLITDLTTAEWNGQRFSHEEMIMWCWVLLVSGQDTTANLLSGGARALMDFPAQREKLIADSALIPNAVEEMLRWVTPTWYMSRSALQDLTLGGKEIKKGETVYMFYLSANRDPAIYPDPWSFDVARNAADRHLSFGHGRHFCLGQALARMESRIVFEELLQRFPRFEWAGEWERQLSVTSNFPGKVPVQFRAR